MKAVLLADGLGTGISEETRTKPKIEIGGQLSLSHINNIYSHHSMNYFSPVHERCIAFNEPFIDLDWTLLQHGNISQQLSWIDMRSSSLNSATTGGL